MLAVAATLHIDAIIDEVYSLAGVLCLASVPAFNWMDAFLQSSKRILVE